MQDEKKDEEKPRVPEYTDEQKEAIMMSDEFLNFFARAGRVLERALYEDKVLLYAANSTQCYSL